MNETTDAKGKVLCSNALGGSSIHYFAKNTNMTAGTYYIKVTRVDKLSSGWYELKYK